MPSSIFNSKTSWLWTWLLVLLICATSLYSYEKFLQKKGFIASIEQNKDLWSWYRSSLGKHKKELVILGASRSQLDLNIPYLKNKLNDYHITQLSINGHYPLYSLQSLAQDENFKGTVLLSLNAQALEDFYFDMQKPHNQYYKNKASYYKSLDAYIQAFLQSKFRFLHPLLGLQDLLNFYEANHRFIDVFYVSNKLDQSVFADYSKTNTQALLKHFVSEKEKNYRDKKPTPPGQWLKNVKKLQTLVKKIENRGGKVIAVRFPTDKDHWQLDEQYYPRSQYWDKITGLTKFHFKDIAGLEQFDLPDSSHLDEKDSEDFTEILIEEIFSGLVFSRNS